MRQIDMLKTVISTIKGHAPNDDQLAQAVTDAVLIRLEKEDEERMRERFANRRSAIRSEMRNVNPTKVEKMRLVPSNNGIVAPDDDYQF